MDTFLTAYRAWTQAPFPVGSEIDELNDVHGDLHVVDEWVLAAVYPFAEHRTVAPLRVDIDGGLSRLRSRITALRRNLSGPAAKRADDYLAYLDLTAAVYSEFVKAAAGIGSR